MKFIKDNNFFIGRVKSIKYAVLGAYKLITTEHSIMAQFFLCICILIAGIYFNISRTEWLIQTLTMGLVVSVEGLNTAVEKIADYIEPNYDSRIGFIKDIAAGSVFFAALFALTILGIIYIPRILEML